MTFKITKPPDLPEAASKFFDKMRPLLQPIMQPADVPEFLILCELFGLYRQALELSRIDCSDKAARIATLDYLAAFDKLAARFGMTPSDRAKVRAAPGQQPLDEYEKWLAKGGKLSKFTGRVATRQR